MKTFTSILLMLFTTNLFAQNKHSELYNMVENISINVLHTNFEPCDTINKVLKLYACLKPSLYIDDSFYFENYNILDSMNVNTFKSIEIKKPELWCGGIKNPIIYLYTTKKDSQENVLLILDGLQITNTNRDSLIALTDKDLADLSLIHNKNKSQVKYDAILIANTNDFTKKKKRRPKSN